MSLLFYFHILFLFFKFIYSNNDLSYNEEEYYLEEEDNNAYNIGILSVINRKYKIFDKSNK